MTGFVQALSPRLLGFPADPAIGPEAKLLREAVTETMADDTSVFYQGAVRAAGEVVGIGDEAASSGRPLDASTVAQALAVLDALPFWAPAPEIALESDGQIGFDWVVGRDCMLSLNVGHGGMLGYASLIGLETGYGKTPFAGELPERVLALLRLVTQKGQPG